MLQFQKVSKKYSPDITILENISFKVQSSEFKCIVGPSGAGKTTLVKLLLRKELPTSGNILFNDVDISTLPNEFLDIYRQNIGVVFQDYKLIPTKTTYENIAFTLEILGKSDQVIEELVPEVMNQVGLSGKEDIYPKQLSGGEQQRTAIARALVNNPLLLIADEPTGNLDQKTAGQIIKLLQNINDQGTTVLTTTHDPQIINHVNKKDVIKIDRGKIV